MQKRTTRKSPTLAQRRRRAKNIMAGFTGLAVVVTGIQTWTTFRCIVMWLILLSQESGWGLFFVTFITMMNILFSSVVITGVWYMRNRIIRPHLIGYINAETKPETDTNESAERTINV